MTPEEQNKLFNRVNNDTLLRSICIQQIVDALILLHAVVPDQLEQMIAAEEAHGYDCGGKCSFPEHLKEPFKAAHASSLERLRNLVKARREGLI